MTEDEIAAILKADGWISLGEQLPPLNNIFKVDKPIPFTTKGSDRNGAFICSHEEFLPGDEDILKEMGVTHWMACETWELLTGSLNN